MSWDRNIVCLPFCYSKFFGSETNGIPVPRKKKSILAGHSLIGKIHLESDWSEEVFNELFFCGPMQNESNFPFDILQLAGSGTKSLVVPALSSSFKWTPKEVAGRYDSTVYILCKKNIMNEVCVANFIQFTSTSLIWFISYDQYFLSM